MASGALTRCREIVVVGRALALAAILGTSVLTTQIAAALEYAAKPIRATIVDAVTAEPIRGVNVVAVWRLEHRDGRHAGNLQVTEAITDDRGVFAMPGWGPIHVSLDPEGGSRILRLGPEQPDLLMFKTGYRFAGASGPYESGHLKDPMWTGDSLRESYWNGRSLKLERFVGTEADYDHHLSGEVSSLPAGACWWTRIPRMLSALIVEGERLKHVRGWNDILQLRDLPEHEDGRNCGEASVMLGRYIR